MKLRAASLAVGFLSFALAVAAQTQSSIPASAQVPPVIQFSNVATDVAGGPLAGSVEITFSLYNNSQGGESLWSETQNVTLESAGHYSVYLGITKTNGVPTGLFTSGQAHWLGVQIAGQVEQQRVFLVSVPYAMKAGDAATVGGLPPSAFVLASPATAGSTASSAHAATNAHSSKSAVLTPSTETLNYIPMFTDASGDLGNSLLFQSGTNVGLGTVAPAATLDVNGTINAANGFNLGGSTILQIGGQAYDLFLGATAGNANATNNTIENTALGNDALRLLSTGQDNTASGASALGGDTSGSYNTADGVTALENDTSGNNNTASGFNALGSDSTGGNNSAFGFQAGLTTNFSTITGSNDTFVGYLANPGTQTALTNATAIGANAQVTASNAMVLGSINGVNSATANTNVGIGTTTPGFTFDVEGPSGTAPTVNFGSATNAATFTVNGTANITGSLTVNGTPITGSGGGSGGITSVNAGTGLSGGGSSGSVTLSVNEGMVAFQSDLAAGITTAETFATTAATAAQTNAESVAGKTFVPLAGGTMTGPLNLPANGLVAGANQFVLSGGNVGVNTPTPGATLDVNGTINAATQFNLGGQAFAFGTPYNEATGTLGSVFLGFAGSTNNTGIANTAAGWKALGSNTTGFYNTATGGSVLVSNTTGSSNIASGTDAMGSNTTGNGNTASGVAALIYNTTGSYNTAVGDSAGANTNGEPSIGSNDTFLGTLAITGGTQATSLNNATVIGAYAEVDQSNSLVLGSILNTKFCLATNTPVPCASTNVGIGTSTPQATLDVEAPAGNTAPTVNFGAAANPVTFSVNGATNITGSLTVNGTPITGSGGGGGGGGVSSVTGTSGIISSPTTGAVALMADHNVVAFQSDLSNGITTAESFATTAATAAQTTAEAYAVPLAGGTMTGGLTAPELTSGDVVNATNGFNIGGQPFIFGSYASQNAFLGFSGNGNAGSGQGNTASGYGSLSLNTGNYNTAIGSGALPANTTGQSNSALGFGALNSNTGTGGFNTASGVYAMYDNTTGSQNTGSGVNALFYNKTGSLNTALGFLASPDQTTPALLNSTAIGAFSDVTQNNSMVLGSILNVGPCTSANNCATTKVGIGTPAPGFTLDVEAPAGNAAPTVNFGAAANPVAFSVNGATNITGSLTVNGTPITGGGGGGGGVISVSGVTGGGIMSSPSTGSVSLSLTPAACPANTVLVALPAVCSTTPFATLGTNTFTSNQTVNGNITATGTGATVSAADVNATTSFELGGNSFAYGSYQNQSVFLGFAGNPNTSGGANNTAIGYRVLFLNTTGYENTATGDAALTANTTGYDNTATGFEAMGNNGTGVGNTAAGAKALNRNKLGAYNTATGSYALFDDTGSYNTATGSSALNANTTGGNNTADGYKALSVNTTGIANTANGVAALNSNTTGNSNTASGTYALAGNTVGENNTAIGFSAGRTVDNTNLTANPGNNTFLGANAAATTGTLHNATAVGANAVVGEDNALVLGGTGVNAVNVGIGTTKPLYMLDVAGPGRFTNVIAADADLSTLQSRSISATSTNPSSAAVSAVNTAATGLNYGLYAETTGWGGTPVSALNTYYTGLTYAVYAQSDSPYSRAVEASGGFIGVEGTTSGTRTGAAGVHGEVQGVTGKSYGVFGDNSSQTDGAAGVLGQAHAATGATYGVYGFSESIEGTGVSGVGVTSSAVGQTRAKLPIPAGVWGDSGLPQGIGVVATEDTGIALLAINISPSGQAATILAENELPLGVALQAGGPSANGKLGWCNILAGGFLGCDGGIAITATVSGGTKKALLHAVQSPGNWFEDFGSGTLGNGAVTIRLDPVFAQTVNTATEYHVFLTPSGDCKGLYVSRKSAGSFEVRELGGGQSNISFDYRIVAKRSGYENARLEDVTEQYKTMEVPQGIRKKNQ